MSSTRAGRFFDRSRNMWFNYDEETDTYVYEDGSRRPRPPSVDPKQFDTPRSFPSGSIYNTGQRQSGNPGQSSRQRSGAAALGPSDLIYRNPSATTSPTQQSREPDYTYRPVANPAALPQAFQNSYSAQSQQPAGPSSSQSASTQRVDERFRGLSVAESRQARVPLLDQGARIAQYTASRPPQVGQNERIPIQGSRAAGRRLEGDQETPTAQSLDVAQQQAREEAKRAVFTPEQQDRGGLRVLEMHNERNHVRMTLAPSSLNPSNRITDPSLLNSGVRAQGMLVGSGNEGDQERLYSTFKVRPHGFFVVGRVFITLWVEPAGTTAVTSLERNDIIPGRYQDEFIYSKVRRFVIVREGKQYCTALPIVSYGHRGVGKKGVNKSEHVIIYTDSEPAPMPSETPGRGESSMRTTAIRVVPDNPTDKLDPVSRLDLGKVHTVQHNVKVKPYGMVHDSCINALLSQFRNAFANPTIAGASSGKQSRRLSMSMSPYQRTEEQIAAKVSLQPAMAGPAAQLGTVGPGSKQFASASAGMYRAREEAPMLNVPIQPTERPSAASSQPLYGSAGYMPSTRGTDSMSRPIISIPRESRAPGQTVVSAGPRGASATASGDTRQRMQPGVMASSMQQEEDESSESSSDGDSDDESEDGHRDSGRSQHSRQQEPTQQSRPQQLARSSQASSGRSPAPVEQGSPVPAAQQRASSVASQQPRPQQAAQRSQTPSARSGAPAEQGNSRASASGSAAQQTAGSVPGGNPTQSAYQNLRRKEYTSEQAAEVLIRRLIAANPGLSRADAEAEIRGRLYSSQVA